MNACTGMEDRFVIVESVRIIRHGSSDFEPFF
jgi:hypothetical protein